MDGIWRGQRTHYDRVEIEFGWIEEPTDERVGGAGRGARVSGREEDQCRTAGRVPWPAGATDSRLSAWITPEDLIAKRFENTILTIEAY